MIWLNQTENIKFGLNNLISIFFIGYAKLFHSLLTGYKLPEIYFPKVSLWLKPIKTKKQKCI
jgi:hypothetical protein